MRLLLAALLMLPFTLPVAVPARAQDAAQGAATAAPPSASDRTAVQAVIRAQLDAFRRDDAAAAFGFAAPAVQAIFGTPAQFLAMVRSSYQPVYRPSSVDFTDLAATPGGVVQHVELTGPDGVGYTATYMLEKQTGGEWRISACTLAQSTRVQT